jgi:hypothetical protein
MRFTARGTDTPVERPVGIAKPPAVSERSCHACLSYDYARQRYAVGVDLVVLCVDAAACCNRYRRGVSAESYAAGLRGEILAVAP